MEALPATLLPPPDIPQVTTLTLSVNLLHTLSTLGPACHCLWSAVSMVACPSQGLLSPVPRQGGLLNAELWPAGPDGAWQAFGVGAVCAGAGVRGGMGACLPCPPGQVHLPWAGLARRRSDKVGVEATGSPLSPASSTHD